MAGRKKIANGHVYKVDKGVPLTRKKMDLARFPFDKMNVNDSFLVPKEDQPPEKVRLSIFTAVKSFNAHHGKAHKIATRMEDGGLRVWRVK